MVVRKSDFSSVGKEMVWNALIDRAEEEGKINHDQAQDDDLELTLNYTIQSAGIN